MKNTKPLGMRLPICLLVNFVVYQVTRVATTHVQGGPKRYVVLKNVQLFLGRPVFVAGVLVIVQII